MNRKTLGKVLGQKIEKARKRRKYSQQRLADAIKKSRTSIVNVEKGRHIPSLLMVYEITHALKTPIADILPNADELLNYDPVDNILSSFVQKGELSEEGSASIKTLINPKK